MDTLVLVLVLVLNIGVVLVPIRGVGSAINNVYALVEHRATVRGDEVG